MKRKWLWNKLAVTNSLPRYCVPDFVFGAFCTATTPLRAGLHWTIATLASWLNIFSWHFLCLLFCLYPIKAKPSNSNWFSFHILFPFPVSFLSFTTVPRYTDSHNDIISQDVVPETYDKWCLVVLFGCCTLQASFLLSDSLICNNIFIISTDFGSFYLIRFCLSPDLCSINQNLIQMK